MIILRSEDHLSYFWWICGVMDLISLDSHKFNSMQASNDETFSKLHVLSKLFHDTTDTWRRKTSWFQIMNF